MCVAFHYCLSWDKEIFLLRILLIFIPTLWKSLTPLFAKSVNCSLFNLSTKLNIYVLTWSLCFSYDFLKCPQCFLQHGINSILFQCCRSLVICLVSRVFPTLTFYFFQSLQNTMRMQMIMLIHNFTMSNW